MRVQMMGIGHMRMRMAQRLVSMHMTVLPNWHGLVTVKVVPIVMRMRMLVFQRIMPVLVPM